MQKSTEAPKKLSGFTLAEMLTVLAIIVLLGTISVVATSPLIARNRERYAARQVHAAILQARHYAIATNSCASLVVYYNDGFCVVTNAQYEPIAPPVVLPEGCGMCVSPRHAVNNADWAVRVGDRDPSNVTRSAAYIAGYTAGYRPMMVVTFQHDGTVKYVTPDANPTSRPTGAIVIGIGGGTLGYIKDDAGPTDTEIELTARGKFESSGIGIIDNEIIRYSVRYSQTGNRVYIYNLTRGIFTPAHSHKARTAVFHPHETLVIFPLTGGVVHLK